VSRQQRGFTLIELLIVVAIIGMMVAVALPSFSRLRRQSAMKAAAAELRTQFHLTRSLAIARNVNCGMKFLLLGGQWHFAVYQDGDRDGVRNDDIKSGKDRLIARPRVVFPPSSAVTIGLLDIAIEDPDGDPLPPSKSPVAFNVSTICSFSPIGHATPGTIYITDRGEDLYAVRVLGATAKIRVLRYVRETAKWRPW
jgi:prepilin-type N-terminal cleavage/methylation domain-containing protein